MNFSKIMFLAVFAGMGVVCSAQTAPVADHHTHLWRLNASKLVTEPLMEKVALPEALQQLLDKKQQFGGKNTDTAALSGLYTPDVLHLNPLATKWMKGEKALAFIKKSITTFPLFPTSYSITGDEGYIAGYQT